MAGGLPIYVMELPQKKGPKDEELWQSEVWGLLDEIRTRFHAQMPSVQSLQNAIHKVNRKRSALKALYALRQNDPPPISGKDSLLISQLAFFDDPERFGSQVEALNEELKARVGRGEGVAPKGSPRLLIAGTPMPLPDWKLHHILETSGGVAVAEETCTGTRYFEASVQGDAKTQEGLIESIADRFLGVHCACFSPNPERIEDILRLAKSQNADGVIYATLPFCQTYQLEFPRVQEALREAGIPLLSIESDFSDEDAGQLSTRIQAFLEMIGK
jgi:benzoyl-CoA reductase/2-hydroxyglutaryl-CoA dehydratase subunit BcrC/BadD/HgdB